MATLSGSYEERETQFRCARCNETTVSHPAYTCRFCRRGGWRAYLSQRGDEGDLAYLAALRVSWQAWVGSR